MVERSCGPGRALIDDEDDDARSLYSAPCQFTCTCRVPEVVDGELAKHTASKRSELHDAHFTSGGGAKPGLVRRDADGAGTLDCPGWVRIANRCKGPPFGGDQRNLKIDPILTCPIDQSIPGHLQITRGLQRQLELYASLKPSVCVKQAMAQARHQNV